MTDPNLITQLAEALPEGTEVPGWIHQNGPYWVSPRKVAKETFHGIPYELEYTNLLNDATETDLAAFTYAAEGVLLKVARLDRSRDQEGNLVYWWTSKTVLGFLPDSFSPRSIGNPSRPAAALAALRAMKEEK